MSRTMSHFMVLCTCFGTLGSSALCSSPARPSAHFWYTVNSARWAQSTQCTEMDNSYVQYKGITVTKSGIISARHRKKLTQLGYICHGPCNVSFYSDVHLFWYTGLQRTVLEPSASQHTFLVHCELSALGVKYSVYRNGPIYCILNLRSLLYLPTASIL